jgi:TolB-like protein/DNA-binding winged helix-turn-helix (wHTH) protein/Tfp pilus assembly protein PilF
MEGAENKGFVYEFGQFVVDPEERILRVDGIAKRLPAKEFDTLLLLIENNGHALTKEQMISQIWPDAFVEESNLAKQISRLRKLLNTESEQYIETLPKHGYRFSAELRRVEKHDDDDAIVIEKRTVKRVSIDLVEDAPKGTPRLPAARGRLFAKPLFAAAIIILILAVSGAVIWMLSHDTPAIKTIAVMPLRPLSADEYTKTLGSGLTDSLITKLGRLKPLVIRPANSVAQFADSGKDPVDIGRELNVSAVMDGTIMQADGRLRVNIRLLDTKTGQQIWEDRFEGALTGIFDLEDRISEKAARNLLPTLLGKTEERLTKRYTDNPEAFDAYTKGRYFWNKRSEDGFRRAIEYFNEAASKDPDYALAYAGLADCYILLGVWGAMPPNEAFPKAHDGAQRALQADPDLAEAWVSQAFVEWVYLWEFDKAGGSFRRAIDLNPNYALAHHWYAYFLVSMLQNDDAVAEIKKARELEGPVSLSVNTDIGEIYLWAGRYGEAEQYLRDVLKVEPGYAVAHSVLGMDLIKQNRIGEAISELEEARKLEDAPRILSALGHAYALQGEREKAHEFIRKLDELSESRYVSRFSVATIYAGLGESDAAFAELEKAYDERSDTMAILQAYPLIEPLRTDGRFKELEKKVGYR